MIKIIQNVTIRDQVLEQLRTLIISNSIKSGTRLYEEKLADEMGVSRTPVREALHILEREGFLEAIPRVGYVVKTPDIEDFKEIIETRKLLEGQIVIWASQNLTRFVIEELNDNIKRSNEAIQKSDIETLIDLNEKFHRIIDNASGRKRICEINQTLRNYIDFYRIRIIISQKMIKNSIKGHKKILVSMKSKEEDRIREVVNSHIDELSKEILDHFFKNQYSRPENSQTTSTGESNNN